VTKLDRDPASGNALQEISFWLNLERALFKIQEKRESIEVTLTLDILKHAKRFHATVSFDSDTGLKSALGVVNDYNPLMKDFPLNELLSATELDKIKQAVVAIFGHLKKIRSTKYPIQRALRLIEAISRDLSNQLLKVLGTRRLMHIQHDEFEEIMTACFDVFTSWDDEYDKLQGLLRDLVKKKREEMMKTVWRINPAHKRLQTRLDQMRKFRHQHEQLRQVIVRVLRPRGPSKLEAAAAAAGAGAEDAGGDASPVQDGAIPETADSNAFEEVNLAYEIVKEVDCLDVSKEGTTLWDAAIRRYEERIDRVEARITTRLRDLLGTAKNANEMFRIFSRFNALLVRPHIRGAIREYQTQLIQRVKDDIEKLHTKFKEQYSDTTACKMSRVRDIPPVAGSIIWARQIERQLNAYLKRVEDVLGKGWEHHLEGQQLKNEGDSFKAKLNTTELFEQWSQNINQKQLSMTGKIFSVESVKKQAGGGGTLYRLRVNFQPEVITLSKEARNMRWLGFRVPLGIVNKAHQANQLYPYAVSLCESVKSYQSTCARIDSEHGQDVNLLCAGLRREVQLIIMEGATLVWESYRLDPFVHKLADSVNNYQEKTDDLLAITRQIDAEMVSLDTCGFSKQNFTEVINKIQKQIDALSLHEYANLSLWVSKLDKAVETKLAVRLESALKAWIRILKGNVNPEDDEVDATVGKPQIKKIVHELRITNQQMHLHPSLEAAQQELMHQLTLWQENVSSLPRLSHQRYQVGPAQVVQQERDRTYASVFSRLSNAGEVLETAHAEIQKIVQEAEVYVTTWTRYQALWDLQPDQVYPKLGNNPGVWMNVLDEIKAMRKTFDVAETQKEFGPLVILFGKVQGKVSMKYDTWHKDVLGKFGNLMATQMNTLFSDISKARNNLEQQPGASPGASTQDAVALITYSQSLKRKMKTWEKTVEQCQAGQALLFRDRFQFPSGWLDSDQVTGEWSALTDILNRKTQAISGQPRTGLLKLRLRICLLNGRKQKPVEGDCKPDEALQTLAILEGKLGRLQEERRNVQTAKEALELSEGGPPPSEERVKVATEELADLKAVWTSLGSVHDDLSGLRDSPWQTVQPRKLRQDLDALGARLKELPARFRQYAAYTHLKGRLSSLTKANMLERHWKTLQKQLGVSWNMNDLSLGQLWDLDLQRNETVIRDVLAVAQGEKALEEFLRQVTELWKGYELELVSFQNKCRLIRGWDDLFSKVKEHMASLNAMKLSPYFKQFEEEALAWEDRLNRINALFDCWIDVQRRWVYLEGIFSGSADIKTLLPVESQRFASVSSEFLGLMKKVAKSPLIMDVLNIPNAQKQLERLADLLAKIQKSLGEYLERQRASFARFYFVGDEDLLEIIGNSKNVHRLQKHFKKMFAGVHTLKLDEEATTVFGLCSKEGEEVPFVTPVSIKDNPRINDWLTMVEKEMRVTLAKLLAKATLGLKDVTASSENRDEKFMEWADTYQAQLVILAAQVIWSESVEAALASIDKAGAKGDPDMAPLEDVLKSVEGTLNLLADSVLKEQPPVRRKKLEQLIIEYVHQRDVTRQLITDKIGSNKSFEWLAQMRFYFDPKQTDPLKQLIIRIANASFNYGFEYLGVAERLVQTPLTDRCYLTMTQALEGRLGGSPFGPAGTGKTESVKALGNQLGRFVLVFNCDETFDFQAMGRIFVGLCQVGAWGCFDEFNRLEERMLSAVSQQIQGIQMALREYLTGDSSVKPKAELLGREVLVHQDMAVFITMNPGYAGRSNLPDNLKKLFRSLAMTQPDRQLIAQVMLYSQGFRTAEKLAAKVVPFFKLCAEQLSAQSHYDFGLRALKSVLTSAGNVKRDRIQQIKASAGDDYNEADVASRLPEQEILIQSLMETMVPKLVAEDIPLLFSLLSDVFPGIEYVPAEMSALRAEIRKVCEEMHLVYGESGDEGERWVEKVLQVYQITNIQHGLMLVGPSGSGKTKAWRVLLKALERLEGIEGVAHVIDPKSISKDNLYGFMDPNTREWFDGIFTHTLRKIVDSLRGEAGKRQWIIFDGDVDPEWVENLNSVLDDNKLLTLPNGERLGIPPNVRIMFEVQDLKYATLATVSRCGMVWFSDEVLTTTMVMHNYLSSLRNVPVDESDEGSVLDVQRKLAAVWEAQLQSDGIVIRCLDEAAKLDHIMDFSRMRALSSLFSMLNQSARNVIAYNASHPDFPMSDEQIELYASKTIVVSVLWAMSGDGKLKIREQLGEFIRGVSTIPLPPGNSPIIDYEVTIQGEWAPWGNKVPQMEVESHKITATDVVIPTLDTVRHECLLSGWLAEHRPVLLCGPPGSGKTMTLFAALRSLPDMEVVGLNFSSATTPELLLKSFDQYCEYKKTPNGLVLAPQQLNKWLVFFCDEINLPDEDSYGTQRVISFIRQMVEHGGFHRCTPGDLQWVTLERVQFVGACNPPTDPGRKPLSARFMRHVPLVYVDYPGRTSLTQIYGSFNRAMLRQLPPLRPYADPITNAMVDFFLMSQERFTVDQQPHYVYSPREMTRWVRGIHEALTQVDSLPIEGLVRIWAHEALRLFQDRLVEDGERKWTDDTIDQVADKHFPGINKQEALRRPILFSNWLTKEYGPVEREPLRDYVRARLKVFYEEELDVPLVLFNQVLEHVLRIDRVFRQPQGHLLLIGVSGAGKTTLSRFVSWINGLSVFQVKVHNKYTGEDFDEDLRSVLRRTGCKGEKVTFIMDESNVKDSSFLERMNTLLANGEVPGLFEGDEFQTLMTQCKEGAARDGLMLDSHEELYRWFTQQICRNLHVVFTMNPSSDGLKDRASTSPALFNRCVLNWFGDWSLEAYFQVGKEFTERVDLDKADYSVPDYPPMALEGLPSRPNHREMVNNAFVFVHQTLHQANQRVAKRGGRVAAITPRHFLDFIHHYVKLTNEKRADLEEQQLHLNKGLTKIRETVEQVEVMQSSLSQKRSELERMNEQANQKLKQMVHDQQVAEESKKKGEMLQKSLAEKEIFIAEKTKEVTAELSQVEPAVSEAKQAVNAVTRQQLVEVRSLPNPPPLVKLALESVCTMLGEPTQDWKSIRTILMRDNFISQLLNYQTEDLSGSIPVEGIKRKDIQEIKAMKNPPTAVKMAVESICLLLGEKSSDWKQIQGVIVKDTFVPSIVNYKTLEMPDSIRETMKKKYLSNPDYNFEKVNRASIACGPMVKWAIAQISYAEMLQKVEPLRAELKALEVEAGSNRRNAEECQAEISRLEKSIAKYKEEYAALISQAQAIKSDLASVEAKVSRSVALLSSLSNEKKRWESGSDAFKAQMETIVGDCLISSAFMAYAGYFDQHMRTTLFTTWSHHLQQANIKYRSDLARVEYLSNPDERLRWTSNALPSDDLCTENAIILKRFNRYPLIVDPSGQATEFITNEYKGKKITRTSFLDDSFRKTLESALRFGTPLLVQDVESYDPILNPVLNREVRRTGGRTLMTLGDQDIDLSPTFTIFLSTRDPSVDFSPDLCSRVTFVNFTVTRSSLQNQCLNAVLQAERPDVDKKRGDLLRMQGEFQARLRQLEQELLRALSAAQGNILNDDAIITQLETLKKEAAEVSAKAAEADQVMEEVENVSRQYQPLAQSCSAIFFTLEGLSQLHSLYHYSLQFFLSMFNAALHTQDLTPFDAEFQHFLRSQIVTGAQELDTAKAANKLAELACFKNLPGLVAKNDKFSAWVNQVSPEISVPKLWQAPSAAEEERGQAIYSLLLVQAFRPDRLLAAAHHFVAALLSEDFLQSCQILAGDLAKSVLEEVTSATPLLICSPPGYDASGRVEELASECGKQLTGIAIGSAEGFSAAEKAVNSGAKTGGWIALKNVHLAPAWLGQLEKRLHTLAPHPNFRLFLTAEISPKLPTNIIRTARVFVFEPPAGLKASLMRTLSAIPPQRMSKAPAERSRLYFLLAWFHAVVQERLRYTPLGWAKRYEFNESDLKCACDTIDTWVDGAAMGRANLPPDKIPWDALRTLMSQCIYGGKIDNAFDARLLQTFLESLFDAASFDGDRPIVEHVDGVEGGRIMPPEGSKRNEIFAWINKLPDTQTPSWLGLPNNAEKVLLRNL
uniref:Dynein heavy chain, cytoplasmic n=1 Tax=Macrostomum lignano TaxID=282301 RepID=A0A1I8II96_9PLAT